MITQSYLKHRMDYDPETGIFTRKSKVPGSKNAASWNAQFAGKPAGSVNGRGYINIIIDGVTYAAHRLAVLYVTGSVEGFEVDHINGVKSDNRIENLRRATRSENAKNMPLSPRNKSGVPGVYWNRKQQKWTAQLLEKGVNHYLGSFSDINDAITERKQFQATKGFHPNHGRAA